MAVVVFAVVINRSADVSALTTSQLREIYSGKLTNWKQVGGRDLPIRMVSRVGPDSGSRRVFREKVLGGDQELGISSDDCRQDDDPVATYHRCEVGTTEELLTRVAGSLTAAFLDYLRSTQARPVLERSGLVPCGDLPAGFCG